MFMKVFKFKHSCWKVHILGYIQGFGCLLDGLVIILSLGFFASGFGVAASRLRAGAYIQNLNKLRGDLK